MDNHTRRLGIFYIDGTFIEYVDSISVGGINNKPSLRIKIMSEFDDE